MAIAYSTRAGKSAEDGKGACSPYAEAFADAATTPGITIAAMFPRIADRVRRETNNRQAPSLIGDLPSDDAYLLAG